MKLYNDMTRKKEEFTPGADGTVKMYTCGPTVYNFFHIGNARCFVVFDMLRRYMQYRGMNVKFVQNFTDIDDKMIKRANEEDTTVAAVAEKYIAEYFTDAKGLGVVPADVHPKATENIQEIIDIISALVEKGYAYESEGDVYFETKKFKEYGKLSHMPIDELESGARIDVSEIKKDPLDFALWKSAKPGEPKWPSPWSEGRPGWHIECSAMSRRYLGDTIDIHCGGQDLQFPHHENEIAQSECANGCEFSRFWVHNGYINVNNEKMSKSKGNFFTVRDIAAQYGYTPIRFFLLSSHYRSPVNFSQDILEQSKSALERIANCLSDAKFFLDNCSDAAKAGEVGENGAMFDKIKANFIEAMDDDFNTADGIGCIFELVRELNRQINAGDAEAMAASVAYGAALLRELVDLFGFDASAEKQSDGPTDEEIQALIDERAAAKKAKNYARADEIRETLKAQGVILEDTAQGTKFKRA